MISFLFFSHPTAPPHSLTHSSHCFSSVALFLNINVIFHHQTQDFFPPSLHLTTRAAHPPQCRALHTQCQEVRYDCIITYRSRPQCAPLPGIDSSQTGAGGLKLPPQWISSPPCFYLLRKHSCTAQPCRSCLTPLWLSACEMFIPPNPLWFSFFFTPPWNIYFHVICLGVCLFFAYYKFDICNLSYKVWITYLRVNLFNVKHKKC